MKQAEKQKQIEEKQKRMYFKSKYKNVNSKLDQMTKVAVGKQRDKFDFDNDKGKYGINALSNVGKAIPKWKKGSG